MNIAVLVPFAGKKLYQKEYGMIVEVAEDAGHIVISVEKDAFVNHQKRQLLQIL